MESHLLNDVCLPLNISVWYKIFYPWYLKRRTLIISRWNLRFYLLVSLLFKSIYKIVSSDVYYNILFVSNYIVTLITRFCIHCLFATFLLAVYQVFWQRLMFRKLHSSAFLHIRKHLTETTSKAYMMMMMRNRKRDGRLLTSRQFFQCQLIWYKNVLSEQIFQSVEIQ